MGQRKIVVSTTKLIRNSNCLLRLAYVNELVCNLTRVPTYKIKSDLRSHNQRSLTRVRFCSLSIVGSFARWLSNGGVTSGPIQRENEKCFLRPFVFAGRLLTGWKAACSGESGRVRLRLARAKATFHPVSRQTAQKSGVRKRRPFSTGVNPPL